MDRYRIHGEKIVARITVNDAAVTDCPRRQTGAVDLSRFRELEKLALNELLELLRNRPQMTAAQDRSKQHDALRRMNERNAEFWKGRVG